MLKKNAFLWELFAIVLALTLVLGCTSAFAAVFPATPTVYIGYGAGGGTIDGFALAPDCELSIVNLESAGGGATIPFTFANTTGLDDISNWTVTVNGRSRSAMLVSVSDSGFTVRCSGLMVIIE